MNQEHPTPSLEPEVKRRKVFEVNNGQPLEHIVRETEEKRLIPIEDSKTTENRKELHILKSFKPTTAFPNVTERYLTPYYHVNEESAGDDTCIWVHSNRICLISLASSHDIIKMQKKIKCINFKVTEKLDRASNKVSGKSKHGAQPLQPSSTICSIECEDGGKYSVKCNMTGKLMEVNDALLKKPELLFEPPHKGGYLAIALPNINRFETLTTELLTQESYNARIAIRQTVT
ncbi:protein Abitram [Diprion similis]|uniref:protein Abitram n=1 Tax=Diprion similis TaxID=362088 RepID=UPI001EF9B00F|nr:protein Abitram [Diprion similis]XP_046747812.1 protein Abitram [Diprion similis]